MIQQSLEEKRLESYRRIKGSDEKVCESCGEIIKIRAKICPKCGVRLRKHVSKAALLLLTFFLGGIGIHRFYLGNIRQGLVYVVFSWTGIPAVIALTEFFIYAFTSSERIQEKYSLTLPTLAKSVGLAVTLVYIGIVAAIVIPEFAAFHTRAYNVAAEADVRNAVTAQEAYFLEHKRYSASIEALIGDVYGLYLSRNVRVDVQCLDGKNYVIVAYHESGTKKYMVRGPNGKIQELPK